ncbi:SufE family protein [Vibrio marisflavi]|uniref:Sulfur acceptor protein CsdE n=1 Tax=Vibrio marisflavi CECT 7928 TaxID=634439 RepID=A0ABN8E9J6_9VIBR|nr:SufE family protein [Vibrio marisflavi]CAH0541050.1 Sulfur acceptor protein CsdE [Vibrio marisflavi CECT 7928]
MSIENYSDFGSKITSEDIAKTMSDLTGWEDKYRQVIQWGKQLPKFTDEQKQEEIKVSGCESQVWLVCEQVDGVWQIAADSDARIVRGLITLVLAAYDGKTSQQIAEFDIEQYFNQLGLIEHLSPSRGNGLYAIVEEVRQKVSQADKS